MNVLLIEDNLIDIMAFNRILKKESLICNLDVVKNIRTAKQFLNRNKYNLIVCDLNLPDGTAFDLTAFFAENDFVLISGYVDAELVKKASQAGINRVISKSSDLKQLTEMLNLLRQKAGVKLKTRKLSDKLLEKEQHNSVLAHLKRIFDNNPLYITDIIQSYLDENPKLITRLNLASEINDKQQIIKTAHRLKSGYMLMGLKELEHLAADLEVDCPTESEILNKKIQSIADLSQQSYHALNLALLELNSPT